MFSGIRGMHRYTPIARFTIVLAAAATSSCGVLDLPDDARRAVADWRDRNGETDPCRIDAMEHCVGGSAAAAACGPECAILLGQLLEQRQGDGNAMDLHNNEAGATRCGLPILADNAGVDSEIVDAVGCCERLLRSEPSELRIDGPCN